MTFLTSYLGVILQVSGSDDMSTSQNGAAAYLVSWITYLPGWFPVAFPAVFVFQVSFSCGRSSLTAEAFL